MSELIQNQIQKFDGKNFTSWKFRIISILEGKDLNHFLLNEQPVITNNENELITEDDIKEWKRKDAQVKSIITCAMTDTQVSLILTCKTAKQIWDSLHRRYEGDIKKQMVEARNDVSRLMMKNHESWQEYILRSEKLLEFARILGAEIDDEEFIISLLRGLPQKYNSVAMQFDNVQNPSVADIRRTFKLHDERNGYAKKKKILMYIKLLIKIG